MALTTAEHQWVQAETRRNRNAAARRRRAADVQVLAAQTTSGAVWAVAVSRSEPGRAWVLSPDANGRLRCPCPGYRWRGRCRHVDAMTGAPT